MSAAAVDRARGAMHLFGAVRDTLRAADQVACEFDPRYRKRYLAQAIRREHEGHTIGESYALAEIYITADKRGMA